MTAFVELSAAYHDRRIRNDPGRPKVVGLIGATIPVELVLAAGALPIAAATVPGGATPAADRYLERHFDDEVRATLEAILAGGFEWLDLLVVARSSDAHLDLYYVLKEITRLGEGSKIPPLHLYDLLHGRSAPNRAYGLARVGELAARLEALTGQAVTPDRLRAAVQVTNARRAAVNRVLEARWEAGAGITGVAAMTVLGAGRFLGPARHAELLAAFLAESRPPVARRPRVVLTAGTELSNPRLHEAIEAGGAVVVAEDDAWGSRSGGHPIPDSAEDIAAAVFDKYFLDVPSPRLAPAAARDEWLGSVLARRPDALVVFIPPSDRWFGWDLPRMRSLGAEAGVPTLVMNDLDPQPVRGFFAEALK